MDDFAKFYREIRRGERFYLPRLDELNTEKDVESAIGSALKLNIGGLIPDRDADALLRLIVPLQSADAVIKHILAAIPLKKRLPKRLRKVIGKSYEF